MATPHKTASGTVEESPLVLIDVTTNEGREGHGLVFTYNAAALKPTADLATNLAPLVEGEELAPAAIAAKTCRAVPVAGNARPSRDGAGWD
jgi:mandelate racemase